jgi:hypothetical protein
MSAVPPASTTATLSPRGPLQPTKLTKLKQKSQAKHSHHVNPIPHHEQHIDTANNIGHSDNIQSNNKSAGTINHPISTRVSQLADLTVSKWRDYTAEKVLLLKAEKLFKLRSLSFAMQRWRGNQLITKQQWKRRILHSSAIRCFQLRSALFQWKMSTLYSKQAQHSAVIAAASNSGRIIKKFFTRFVQYTIHCKERQIAWDQAQRQQNQNLLRELFHYWRRHREEAQLIKHKYLLATKFSAPVLLKFYLKSWRFSVQQIKLLSGKGERIWAKHGQLVQQNHFIRWLQRLKFKRKLGQYLVRIEKSLIIYNQRCALLAWRSNVAMQREKEQNLELSRRSHTNNTKRLVFSLWKEQFCIKQSQSYRDQRTINAAKYYFLLWQRNSVDSCFERQLLQQGKVAWRRKALEAAILQLKQNVSLRVELRSKVKEGESYYNLQVLLSFIQFWHHHSSLQQHKLALMHQAAIFYAKFNKKGVIQQLLANVGLNQQSRNRRIIGKTFRKQQIINKIEQNRVIGQQKWRNGRSAVRFRYLSLLKRHFRGWRASILAEQATENQLFSLSAPIQHRITQATFLFWLHSVRNVQLERSRAGLAAFFWYKTVISASFSLWQRSLNTQKLENQLERRAEAVFRAKSKQNTLEKWLFYTHNQQISKKKQRSLLQETSEILGSQQRARVFAAWKGIWLIYYGERQRINRAAQFHARVLQFRAFNCWKLFIAIVRHKKRLYSAAKQQEISQMMSAAWKCWRFLLRQRRIALQKHVAALRQWANHREKRCFAAWRAWKSSRKLEKAAEEGAKLRFEGRMKVFVAEKWISTALEWKLQRVEREKLKERSYTARILELAKKIGRHWEKYAAAKGKKQKLPAGLLQQWPQPRIRYIHIVKAGSFNNNNDSNLSSATARVESLVIPNSRLKAAISLEEALKRAEQRKFVQECNNQILQQQQQFADKLNNLLSQQRVRPQPRRMHGEALAQSHNPVNSQPLPISSNAADNSEQELELEIEQIEARLMELAAIKQEYIKNHKLLHQVKLQDSNPIQLENIDPNAAETINANKTRLSSAELLNLQEKCSEYERVRGDYKTEIQQLLAKIQQLTSQFSSQS